MLIFRQLFDPQSSTYTYLLADSDDGAALFIDPVFEQARRDIALLEELGLNLKFTIETHVHADHITAAWLLKQQLNSEILISKPSGATGADRYLDHDDSIVFGQRFLKIRSTPGHTDGCITLVLDDESRAFTGDCLLIRGAGRTDFQQGNPAQLYRSVYAQIFSLPSNCLLYPGHDYRGLSVTSVAEERQFNPRLGGQLGESDFVGYMNNLGLPHPKKMDIAVPANLKCGQADAKSVFTAQTDWAPLNYTFAGIWEIQPQWVEEHSHGLQLIDVREIDEFNGPLGHIHNSINIPLGALNDSLDKLSQKTPIVTICRAGGRSAQATLILQKAGFEDVANLAGGMLRWRGQNLAVVGGAD